MIAYSPPRAHPPLRASLVIGLVTVLSLLASEQAAAQQAGAHPQTAMEDVAPPREHARPRSRGERKRPLEPGEKLDLNTASVDELQRLPGIGAKRAEQIVNLRNKRAFKRVTELRRVRGIGKKTLRRLLPHVKVSPPPKSAKAPSRKAKKRSRGG